MKHTHITIAKEHLERFKTACETNISTKFRYTSDAPLDHSITCHIDYIMLEDIFHLGCHFANAEKI